MSSISFEGDSQNQIESVASRKLAAAQMRKARKAAWNPRSRLLSDSSESEPLKGILKNTHIPTKRSVSECVDDLSFIMADLDLNIRDLPNNSDRFCTHQNLNEKDEDIEEEDEDDNYEDEDENEEDDDDTNSENKIENHNKNGSKNRKCDCNFYGDKNNSNNIQHGQGKPKKSVRFDERVYETFFFASRLYDRKLMPKFHFSTRHHPQNNQKQNKNKKGRQRSKSESDGDLHNSTSFLKSDNSNNGCKPTKSQRARQSKKDKKKRLNSNKENEVTDTSSDDQGYHSHSFSD